MMSEATKRLHLAVAAPKDYDFANFIDVKIAQNMMKPLMSWEECELIWLNIFNKEYIKNSKEHIHLVYSFYDDTDLSKIQGVGKAYRDGCAVLLWVEGQEYAKDN